MEFTTLRRLLVLLLLICLTPWATAEGMLVEKKTFSLPRFTTAGGTTLEGVRIGYETYGTLNAARDNAIFIPHMFLGTSHAAGKYRNDDAEPGYWDAIIGPGKPVDTNRWFVVSADTLANTNARDPSVITTGPLSTDPRTGRAYGRAFPQVSLSDSVRVHRALLDSLGVRRLHAVAGWSMGALQSYQWAAAYPEFVGRVIAVGGAAQTSGTAIGWLNAWSRPIVIDPKWKDGAYSPGQEPVDGLDAAIQIQLMTVAHEDWINAAFGRRWADEKKDPARDSAAIFAWEAQQAGIGRYFAGLVDANSYLMAVKAIQTFTVGDAESYEKGMGRVRAPALVIGVPTDMLVTESALRKDVETLQKNGVRARYVPLPGAMGHLEGRFGISRAGEAIRAFLDE